MAIYPVQVFPLFADSLWSPMPVQMLRYNLSLAADRDSMWNVFGGVIPCTQGACSLCKRIVGISSRWRDQYFCWQTQRTEGKRRACDLRNPPCTGTPILSSCPQGAAYCLLWDSAYLTPTGFPGSNQEDNTEVAARHEHRQLSRNTLSLSLPL